MKIISVHPKVLLFLDSKPDRNTAKAEFWYSHGGSWFESSSDRGRMHLMEHCLVARTKDMDENEFKEYCFEHNIQYNAYTSPSVINLNVKSHKDDIYTSMKLFLELFFTPTFTPAVLEREKEIVLREITDRKGDPEYQLWQDVMTEIYTPESYEQHEVLGESDVVASTKIEDFDRLFRSMIDNSVCIITVSGSGFEEDSILKLLEPYTSSLSDKHLPFPHDFKNTFQVNHLHTIKNTLGHKEAALTINIPMPINHDNRPVRGVFSELFLGWNGTGLYDYLRDELGLIYGYSFYYDEPGQVLKIEMNCEIARVPLILDGVYKYFSDFTAKFSQEKFTLLLKTIIKKFEQSRDNLGFDAGFVINNLLNYNTMEKSEEYVERMQNITAEMVKEIHALVLANWNETVVTVVSRDETVKKLTYQF